jgi:hypothetical protein
MVVLQQGVAVDKAAGSPADKAADTAGKCGSLMLTQILHPPPRGLWLCSFTRCLC